MTKTEMLRYLSMINDKLAEKNEFIELYLYDGAVMALVYDARDVTEDIDIMLNQGAKELLDICGEIARAYSLPPNWVSSGVSAMVKNQFKAVDYLPFTMFSNLHIIVPSGRMMLAMKLRAAREKDLPDCIVLLKELAMKNVTREDLWEILNSFYKDGLLDNAIVRKKVNLFIQLVVKRLHGTAHNPFQFVFGRKR